MHIQAITGIRYNPAPEYEHVRNSLKGTARVTKVFRSGKQSKFNTDKKYYEVHIVTDDNNHIRFFTSKSVDHIAAGDRIRYVGFFDGTIQNYYGKPLTQIKNVHFSRVQSEEHQVDMFA